MLSKDFSFPILAFDILPNLKILISCGRYCFDWKKISKQIKKYEYLQGFCTYLDKFTDCKFLPYFCMMF